MSLENSSVNERLISKNNQGYHNDIIMDFFSELLEFIEIIRRVYKRTQNQYIILASKAEQLEINVNKREFSEIIIKCIFKLYSETTEQGESKYIDVYAKLAENDRLVSERYNKKTGKCFVVKTNEALDVEQLNTMKNALDCTFLDGNVKDRLKKAVKELLDFYEEKEESSCFWEQKEIFRFLNAYYEILWIFLSEDGVLETEGVVEKLLMPMLHLGVDWNERDNCAQIRMTAPVVVSALNMIYERLNQYVLIDVKSEEIEGPVFKEIFLAKIHQIFRYYLIKEKNGQLYHAALSAYMEESRVSDLNVKVRSMLTYNSYQGIRELRLADKILYELKQKKWHKKWNITILGEIDETPMRELIEYIEKNFKFQKWFNEDSPLKLKFQVYTIRTENLKNILSDNCECQFFKYDGQLLNAKELMRILSEGDLFFLLDNCHLYRDDIDEIRDRIIFRQYISSDNYEEYYKRNVARDLSLDCKFMELYNALMMYAWKGRLGFYKKRAREDVIKYIRNILMNYKEKVAYIYISDIDAFKNLECIQKHVVRVEEYNQKEIGIIRFTGQKKEILPVTCCMQENEEKTKRMLVFNIWQFVKHVVLNQRETFENMFLKNPEEQFLSKIYVGLDYSNWKSDIKVSYYFHDKNEINQENIKGFLRIILKDVFCDNENMYYRYLKKSFISFLYGAAKSVEDLIFLYILKSEYSSVGPIRIMGYDSQIKDYYKFNCKYSYKKIYWDAFSILSKENFNFINRYMVFESVRKYGDFNEIRSEQENIEHFLNNIKKACKNIEYDSSALYINCVNIDNL